MLIHKLVLPDGILILEPEGPLEAADFAAVAREIDPYIAEHGKLTGLLLHAKAFPGWENLEAVLAHMQFIESHHQKIERLAVVSDSHLFTEIPTIVGHLVHPQVKHFADSAYEDALQWLRE
jgi:hypothetical protein